MRGNLRRKGRERDRALETELAMLYRPPTPAAVIRAIVAKHALDARLLPTDRHMQRWAAGQGAGLENAEIALLPRRLRLDPLPEREAVLTDQVVLKSPPFVREFADEWYRYCWDLERIAQRLGGGKARVIEERSVVLAYLLGRLTAAGIYIAIWEPTA